MSFQITSMRADHTPGVKSDAVARFDFTSGPFTVRRSAIRKRHDTGRLFIDTPGRTVTGGISINRSSEFWHELEQAALEEFQWLKQA
jgi:hypothetical protein